MDFRLLSCMSFRIVAMLHVSSKFSYTLNFYGEIRVKFHDFLFIRRNTSRHKIFRSEKYARIFQYFYSDSHPIFFYIAECRYIKYKIRILRPKYNFSLSILKYQIFK